MSSAAFVMIRRADVLTGGHDEIKLLRTYTHLLAVIAARARKDGRRIAPLNSATFKGRRHHFSRAIITVTAAVAVMMASSVGTALIDGPASAKSAAITSSLTAASAPPGVGSISAGSTFACGIKTTGQAICWGYTNTGDTKAPSGTFTQVSAGFTFACGIKTTGQATCWGYTDTGDTKAPSGTFTQVSAGSTSACGSRPQARLPAGGTQTQGTPRHPRAPSLS